MVSGGDLAHRNLTAEERAHILDVFHEEMAPKLRRLDARSGVIDCGFAGDRFKCWMITFRSRGSAFEIVEFEYDEEGGEMSLDALE